MEDVGSKNTTNQEQNATIPTPNNNNSQQNIPSSSPLKKSNKLKSFIRGFAYFLLFLLIPIFAVWIGSLINPKGMYSVFACSSGNINTGPITYIFDNISGNFIAALMIPTITFYGYKLFSTFVLLAIIFIFILAPTLAKRFSKNDKIPSISSIYRILFLALFVIYSVFLLFITATAPAQNCENSEG
jgi:hypothetical protein